MDDYQRIKHLPSDQTFYDSFLRDYLPDEIFDCHLHVWLKEHKFVYPNGSPNPPTWTTYIEDVYSAEDVKRDYQERFPGKKVRAMPFGRVYADMNVEENNKYVGQVVRDNPGWRGLAVTKPEWDADKLYQEVEGNGLVGMKPYVSFAPKHIPSADITIFDIITREQFEIADERGYVVVLHIPRAGRIKDEKNITQLLEIEEKYPNVKLIVAHIGRAYCEENLGDALERLTVTKNMCFDFSGNTNKTVIRRALETFGSKRVVYGSDFPITHIHMHRIYEGEEYVNLIPKDERSKMLDFAHMRALPEGEEATYYVYESLSGFIEAAKELNYTKEQVYDVMCGNALRILGK